MGNVGATGELDLVTGTGPVEEAPEAAKVIQGRSPWRLAYERLRRDRAAVISAVIILIIVVCAIAAPVFASITGHGVNQQFRVIGLKPDGFPAGAGGKFLLQWGSFVDLSDPNGANAANANTGFYGPRGVAIGPDGNVYVTDTGNKRVLIFDKDGAYQREISSGMSPTRKAPDYPFTQPGELNEPIGIAVDRDGNVYVADTNNRRIQKFTAAGAPAAQWPVPAGSWEPGPYLEPFLALDGAGNLYATAPTSHSVLKFSPTGTLLGQKTAQGDATLQLPTGLTVDDKGTVYVVDTTASRVVNLGTIP